MAKEYDKELTGVLFKNDRKTTDKHPDYQGSVTVNGQEYWLSAWIKEASQQSKRAGQKFMSLALTLKQDESTQTSTTAPGQPKTPDSDIPF